MLPAKTAVVVSIDRLGAGWLGPYGNTWLETPHFNSLAARSLLFETVLSDSPDLMQSCRAWWSGRHAMQPDTIADGGARSLPQLAAAAGARSLLITDDPAVARHPLAAEFGELQRVEQPAQRRNQVEVEETELFRLFSAGVSALEDVKEPALVWIHSRGMGGPWDAPLEFRNQFADEDDPEPPRLIDPPDFTLPSGFDPDQVLGYVHAYAGQVVLADLCLGFLLQSIGEHPLADQSLLAVTSPRGFPLGEHRRVGQCDRALYGELLHVPLFVRLPDDEQAATRLQCITQPHELPALIAECCGWGWEGGRETAEHSFLEEILGAKPRSPRSACAVGPGQRAIRTPAWFLHEGTGDEPRYELFVKPDDRWEANEVAARCGEEIELLAAELNRFEQAAATGHIAQSPPLAEELFHIWR